MNYFIFRKVLGNVFLGEVANLQSTSVKFLQDAVCQKSLKSVNIWLSYLKKNKNVIVFGTVFQTDKITIHKTALA